MIVDVHTHLPSHQDTVPEDEMLTETTMRSGETVQLTNSIDDYYNDMSPVDKDLHLRHRAPPVETARAGATSRRLDDSLNHNDIARSLPKRTLTKPSPSCRCIL